MARYNPPTRVTTSERPLLSLVTAVDPTFVQTKYYDVEYQFTGKNKYANLYQRGSFNSYSNIYDVGLPYGGTDPLVVAARPMYAGVPTGGWA